MKHGQLDECTISFNGGSVPAVNNYITKSLSLRNGIHTFSVLNITAKYTSCIDNLGLHNKYVSQPYSGAPISIAVGSEGGKCLYCYPLINDSLITVYVHDDYLFLKLIEGDKVKSTTGVCEAGLFNVSVCSLMPCNSSHNCDFHIHNHVQ